MQRATRREARSTASMSVSMKRAIDLAGSTIALILLSPLFLVISIAVMLDSRGPVFFRQTRVGKDGVVFTCLKFRSMHRNADERVHQAAIQRLMAGERLSDDEGSPFKLTHDPRVTRVGSFLRRTSLDELPQLINVFRGEMSLVGPRPAIPYELENYKDWHHLRYQVKPGITGLWQVEGRGALTFDEMLRLDVEYATHWTVGTDVRLMARTIPAVLRQVGAR
jgi:lipopolysaccharide/colanic/teichoic acid biosynthesis glycosyltransferase